MRIGVVGLAKVTLEAWSVFAQVVPQAGQVGPALGSFGRRSLLGKSRRQFGHRMQMVGQQMAARMRKHFRHGQQFQDIKRDKTLLTNEWFMLSS